jgi:hypothetical protein
MPEYYIDDENSVHIPDTTANDRDANTFASLEELIEIAAQWPLRRLVEVWNKLPGVHPVRRFEDRQVAIRRIWRELGGDGGAARQGRRRRRVNKTELVLALLRRPEGATLKALMKATKWQAHSVRGFVSGKITKDLGLAVKSFRRGGERVYALVTTSPSGEA